jgi:hypothetical protein
MTAFADTFALIAWLNKLLLPAGSVRWKEDSL